MTDHAANIAHGLNTYVEGQINLAVTDVAAQRDAALQSLALLEPKLIAAEENASRYFRDLEQMREIVADLEERIRQYEGAARLPVIGACPLTGGLSAASRDRVIARWGGGDSKPVAVRLFAPESATWAPAPANANAGVLLLSWKPPLAQNLNEATVVAALRTAPAGTKVSIWHESDGKIRKGEGSAAAFKRIQAEFYAIVKRNRPDLVVTIITTGWLFNPSEGYDPLDYIEPSSMDVLGLDLDGLYGPFDFLPFIAHAQQWMESVGISRYTITEYGLKVPVQGDPEYGRWNAADRARWLTSQTNAIAALPWSPEEICLFESDAGAEYRKYILTTQPEIDAWNAQAARG